MPPTPTYEERGKQRSAFAQWLAKAPFFVGAILFHLLLFLMFATYVVFESAPPKPEPPPFGAVKIAPRPPPPVAPPQSLGGGAMNTFEPTLQAAPPQATTSVVTAKVNPTFNVSSSKIPQPSLPSALLATGTSLSNAGATGTGVGTGSVFGSDNNNGNGFTGYFYDLKQTPDHQPTNMTVPMEQSLLQKFFANGWNEQEWATRFLKSPKPLYANEFMIPFMSSNVGPKSFGLEKVCEPGFWAAIYHVQITASRTGDFRVAGYGDDFLIVRVDGRIVLDSGYYPPVTTFKGGRIYPSNWLAYHPPGRADYGRTVVGSSFHMETGTPMTIDVFIGDASAPYHAGICGYFLFLLQDGKEYPNDAGGNPIFPLLQIQPHPDLERKGEHVPFTAQKEDVLLP